MTSSDPGRRELLSYTRELLSFLEMEHGASFEAGDGPWRTVLAYCMKWGVVEVEFDWRDKYASLLLCRSVEGARPPGYYMHEGQRMRVHLVMALECGNTDEREYADYLRAKLLQSGAGFGSMRSRVQLFSVALHEFFDRLPVLLRMALAE